MVAITVFLQRPLRGMAGRRFRFTRCGLFVGLCLLVAGCKPREEVRHYKVEKENPKEQLAAAHPKMSDKPDEAPSGPAMPGRMLAAAALQGDQAWFFKVIGPPDRIAPVADGFQQFIKSLSFVDDKPKWKLPEGWSELPASGMRYATLEMGKDGMHLTVTPLKKPAGEEPDYLLANVNMWRSQVSLPPIAAEQLSKESQRLDYAGGQALVVDLTGSMTTASLGGSFHARATTPATPSKPGSESPPEPAASSLTTSTPEGWKPGQLMVSRGGITLRHEAAFEIHDGDRRVDVTVDRMPASGLTQNINRWRGQVDLKPVTPEELAKQTQKLDVNGLNADYVVLLGAQQSILGAVLTRGEDAFFIKLMGDPELAKREQERFEAFVKSLRFK